jgi:hypothetical protein
VLWHGLHKDINGKQTHVCGSAVYSKPLLVQEIGNAEEHGYGLLGSTSVHFGTRCNYMALKPRRMYCAAVTASNPTQAASFICTLEAETVTGSVRSDGCVNPLFTNVRGGVSVDTSLRPQGKCCVPGDQWDSCESFKGNDTLKCRDFYSNFD